MATAARRNAMAAIVQYTYIKCEESGAAYSVSFAVLMIRICGSSYSLLLLKHYGGVMTMG